MWFGRHAVTESWTNIFRQDTVKNEDRLFQYIKCLKIIAIFFLPSLTHSFRRLNQFNSSNLALILIPSVDLPFTGATISSMLPRHCGSNWFHFWYQGEHLLSHHLIQHYSNTRGFLGKFFYSLSTLEFIQIDRSPLVSYLQGLTIHRTKAQKILQPPQHQQEQTFREKW